MISVLLCMLYNALRALENLMLYVLYFYKIYICSEDECDGIA